MPVSSYIAPSHWLGGLLQAFRARPEAHGSTRTSVAVWSLSVWMAVVGNVPLYQRMAALDLPLGQKLMSGAALALIIFAITAALLSLFNWPRVFRPAASALLLISAFNVHFMRQFGAVIDPTMLANALHTDVREVRDLLSPALLSSLLLVAAPPLWWLWRKPLVHRPLGRLVVRNAAGCTLGILFAAGAAVAAYPDLAPLMRNEKSLRYMANPLNAVYAAGAVLAERWPQQVRPLLPVGADAHLGAGYDHQARPPLLVLVIGETARADRFSLNGYQRNTTPVLAKWRQGGELVNFSNVTSCGTNTLVSVPCLFSPLARNEGGDSAPDRENLLDVLQRAGLAVLWLDNQSGCKGVCDRVPSASTRGVELPEPPPAGLCEGTECLDQALLVGLDKRLAALDAERRKRGVVLVLHQMGSHGPAYHRRAPTEQKRFLPECESNNLTQCDVQAVSNAYDNSIAYTDQFLGQVLRWTEQKYRQGAYDTGLIYVSDHGESLGEQGLYLHGVPYAVAPSQQTHVPMVSWLSKGLQQRTGVRPACLRQREADPLSHDHFFHTVLGLLDVVTQTYEPALDAFLPCVPPEQLVRRTRSPAMG